SGRPVPGYALRVVDEHGIEVDPGHPGDLMVRGESCAAYYWHQRAKTRFSMRGEWFHTGDRYVTDGEGRYVYQGRSDDMIKVGGLWVSPADIEACLVRHEAVSEAAVIGVRIEDVSRIKAFVICSEPPEDREALADELRQWCKEYLRRYEYPHVVEFVEDLPRTPTGKVQRFKLREAEEVQAALAGTA
ncbi:MAG: AMP-binding protein, partial [Solirubrobacterales bacterium]|nr:AMP-binding protein [Solirubrobacterales bacterium]